MPASGISILKGTDDHYCFGTTAIRHFVDDADAVRLAACRFSPTANANPTPTIPRAILSGSASSNCRKIQSLIAEAEGKVVKVISQLILSLPMDPQVSHCLYAASAA